MLERVHRFLLAFPLAAAVPRAAAALARILTLTAELRLAAQQQCSGRNHSAGGVDRRAATGRRLRQVLAGVNRTARVLDEEGLRPLFRLPRTRSYPALLASARAVAVAAAEREAAFIECGHAPDFLAEIATVLADFEAATAQKHDGKIAQVASTALLKETARRAVLAATELDSCARNHYRDQPEMLAAWRAARHIERGPRRQEQKETTPAATPPLIEATPSSNPASVDPLIGATHSEPNAVRHECDQPTRVTHAARDTRASVSSLHTFHP